MTSHEKSIITPALIFIIIGTTCKGLIQILVRRAKGWYNSGNEMRSEMRKKEKQPVGLHWLSPKLPPH